MCCRSNLPMSIYPETVTAPATASRFPAVAVSPRVVPPAASTILPATLTRTQIAPRALIRSPRKTSPRTTTMMGWRFTSTVALATDVRKREEIQVAKCAARRRPLSSARARSRRGSRSIRDGAEEKNRGAVSSAENAMRWKAMASGGAVESRMRMAEVLTKRTATMTAARGSIAGLPRSRPTPRSRPPLTPLRPVSRLRDPRRFAGGCARARRSPARACGRRCGARQARRPPAHGESRGRWQAPHLRPLPR